MIRLLILALVPLLAQVSPSGVSLRAAGTQQFTVSPSGCLWQTPIGTVNLAGYYQAPLVIPFNLATTVSCGGFSATVNLLASSLPVAGLEYIRGGNFAGSIIVLSIIPPLVASNGQIFLNGSTVNCPPQTCSGIILSSNGDGSVGVNVNSAAYVSRGLLEAGSCQYIKSTNGTTAYTYSFGQSCTQLTAYTEGMNFNLWVDADCTGSCSLNIDNLGPVAIKSQDTSTDPNGALKAGQVQSVTYTPVINLPGQFVFVLRP